MRDNIISQYVYILCVIERPGDKPGLSILFIQEEYNMGNTFIVDDGVSGLTPAHTYDDTSEFESILNDIARDLIPTGTGKIFPVVWKTDFEDSSINQSPFAYGNESKYW